MIIIGPEYVEGAILLLARLESECGAICHRAKAN